MKVQACQFKRIKGSALETGIAFVPYFNSGSVTFIVDLNGKKLSKPPWDFWLVDTPLSHLDTEYPNGD